MRRLLRSGSVSRQRPEASHRARNSLLSPGTNNFLRSNRSNEFRLSSFKPRQTPTARAAPAALISSSP